MCEHYFKLEKVCVIKFLMWYFVFMQLFATESGEKAESKAGGSLSE